MNQPTLAATFRLLAIAMVWLLFSVSFLACAADHKKTKTYHLGDTQAMGFINPDGGKTVLIVPNDLSDSLTGYSWQQVDGLKFYQFSSWKDTASFLGIVNQRQEHMIRDLTVNVEDLARRVKSLERSGVRARTPPVDRRIKALEKKVKELSGDGNL